jgi:hypothetical protein
MELSKQLRGEAQWMQEQLLESISSRTNFVEQVLTVETTKAVNAIKRSNGRLGTSINYTTNKGRPKRGEKPKELQVPQSLELVLDELEAKDDDVGQLIQGTQEELIKINSSRISCKEWKTG